MAEIVSKTNGFECDVCNRMFARKVSLIEHKNIHLNRYPFECEICGKKFRQNSNYCKHQKLHQKTGPKYKCDLCGHTFVTQSYLKSHLLSHNTIKSCLCDKCGHTFKHRSDLSRHMKIHDNQRQYKCKLCLFGFNDRSALRRHTMKVHHKTDPNCDKTSNKCNEKLITDSSVGQNLNDCNYLNSVIDYINICRILPVPLPDHIFQKLIELQKEIALYLGIDNKCEKTFSDLRTGLHDLNGVIWEHLHYRYKILN